MIGSTLQQLAYGLCSLVFFGQFRTPSPPPIPIVSLTLAPTLYEQSPYMDVTMDLYSRPVARSTGLLSMTLNSPGFPLEVNDYNSRNPITAYDRKGLMKLAYYDAPGGDRRTWYLEQDTDGDGIRLHFRACPRNVTSRTKPGPRLDLREDRGGLIGAGISFIPDLEFLGEREEVELTVNWDVSRLHAGDEVVWTFGDGRRVKRIGRRSMLTRSIYMVGPVAAVKSSIALPGKEHGVDFGIYWFGDSPFDINDLASRLMPLYHGMATFFNTTEDVYKIFIRRSIARSFGGTAVQSGFVLEYYDGAFEMIDLNVDSAFDILAHEMVHNWPRMDRCSATDGCSCKRTWYIEGIAVYYAAMLPSRFGLVDEHAFRLIVNRNAQAYYTSPFVTDSIATVKTLTWQSFHAQRVPYYRGFMYLILLNAQLREKTGGSISIDDIVLSLFDRQRRGLSYGPQDFLDLLRAHLGEDALKGFDEMMTGGQLITPPADSFSGTHLNCTIKLPQFELGFEESSVPDGTILGLVPGSAAAVAGILNGDVIQDASLYGWAADDVDREMRLQLRRGGEMLNVTYLPRGKTLVNSCQLEIDQ